MDDQVRRLEAWFSSYGDRDRGTMLDCLHVQGGEF